VPKRLRTEISYLRAEVEHLRRRAEAAPGDSFGVESRLNETLADCRR
jgi:hypothetical protein